MVRDHGAKGKWHEVKFKALEDPTIVVDARWQNFAQPWSYTLSSSLWWCHIDKEWPFFKHETHMKNNYTQYTSCMDELMKACMLEVYMAMIRNHSFPKN
jgi:hypothetical protein